MTDKLEEIKKYLADHKDGAESGYYYPPAPEGYEHIKWLDAELARVRAIAAKMRAESVESVTDYEVGGWAESVLAYAEEIDGLHVKTISESAAEYLTVQRVKP